MCEPTTIMAGLAALGTTVQIKQSNDAADAAIKTANLQANSQASALTTQANQVTAAASEKASAAELQAAQVASAARASAGEAGVTGTGVNRIVSNIGTQLARNQGVSARNLLNQQLQIATQQESTEANRVATVGNAESQKTSGLSAALQIATSAYGGYSAGTSLFGSSATQAAAGTALAEQGLEQNFLGGSGSLTDLFTNPEAFRLAPDIVSKSQATATGFSEDYLSGALFK